ncbi:MAG: hypothetical protein HKN23_11095 [Verrucomicrobiales bacterium]|nr:hypothetical protein [Verrucomicrobiales bacterium]
MMPRYAFLIFSAVVLICGALSGCKEKAGDPLPLDLFFTADTSGRIEPCGCFTGQFGGLTRISTHLKKNDPAAPESIRLEIGNTIAGTADYEVLQFKHLLEAAAALNYRAVNLGGREAALSAETLRELAEKSPVPLLSANILNADSGEPIATPFLVTKQGELKVGLVGVVSPQSLKSEPGEGVRVAGMTETLRKILLEVGPQADVLVCLAFADDLELESLAKEFYEFAVILGGDVRQPYPSPLSINRSQVLATTNQARALAEFHAKFDPGTKQLIEPEGTVTLMEDLIEEDPVIRQFSTNYRDEVAKVILAIDNPEGDSADRVPGVKPPATYVGSEACAGCHPKAYEVWSKTGHAHAFDSLNYRDSKMDPSCVKCHVVGFGEPGGYLRSMAEERKLINVGCESCHGPGSEHVKVRSTASPGEEVLLKMRPVGSGQCTQCHYGEFSRPFNWEEFWPHIQHFKESEMK